MDEETKKKFDEIEKRLNMLEGKREELVIQSSGKKKSVKEYVIAKNPKNDVQKVVVIASYLENVENKEEFTPSEVSGGFRLAKLKVPTNIHDKIQKAISNGWLASNKEKGKYYLTSMGEEAIIKFNKNDKSE